MKKQLRFDEGFDNILTYDYDKEYREGPVLSGRLLPVSGGREAVSLDGKWRFCPDVFNSTVRSRWFEETRYNRDGQPLPYDFDFEQWDEGEVPGVWNAFKPEYALYEGPGVYFKQFDYKISKEKRVFLRIGAANYEARIWLNGRYLGRHLGGFTPFAAEVTDCIKEKNRLIILTDNSRKGDQVPSCHYDWFNYGGIHRSVTLVETPRLYIRSFSLRLSRRNKGRLEYQVSLSGDEEGSGELKAVILVEELGISKTVSCISQEGGAFEARGYFQVDEDSLCLWEPEKPFLYHVTVQAGQDEVRDEIGFRRIEARDRKIFLNGHSVFLRGMCVHEESPSRLKAVNGEDMEETLKMAKELGCNFLRLTHYPHNEQMAKLADRLGIMLWEEIPVYWALEFENPETIQNAEGQLEELILRDQNRASVIIWSVGNENPDTDARYYFMRRLAELARGLDDSRLIGAACLIDVEEGRIKDRLLESLDVAGINEYYGWYLKDFGCLREILERYEADKPVIVTETGAEAKGGLHGGQNEVYTEECQAAVYREQFSLLFQYPFIRGVTPWILYDYASMRRMNCMQRGYNLKGLITADRKHKKMAWDVVVEAYRKKEKEESDGKGMA